MVWTMATFIGFTILVAVISYVKTKGDDQSTADGYFLAGRGLPGFVIAGSLLLTNLSAEQLVGTNGQTWSVGMSPMAFEIVAAPCCIVLALFAAPRYLKSGITTIPELIGLRYDRSTKLWFSIAYILLYIVVQIPVILYSGSLVFENIFNVSGILGVTKFQAVIILCIIISVIGSIYAIFGGLKAVAISDTVNGIGLLIGSGSMTRRHRRYASYLRIAGKRSSISVASLARAAEVSERRAERDLQAMLEKGLWGEEAYLDLGRGMLFRSHEAAEDQERQERQREAPQVPQEAEEGYSGMLRSIRRSNDRIADPELSRKMDRLEEIAGKILKLVEEDPAKKNQAATFLNYYLPTTEKLLDSYADFEEAGVSGENLTQAKEKIRRTMDSIMAGFERQLDALYHADAMDVDSDIRVMETMLRRDGGSVEEDFGLGGTAVATQEDL